MTLCRKVVLIDPIDLWESADHIYKRTALEHIENVMGVTNSAQVTWAQKG